jgi:hypothetical protein
MGISEFFMIFRLGVERLEQMYSYCMFMYLHRTSWHSSATLNEGFRAFSSVVRQMPG